jgi:hypothetical protein
MSVINESKQQLLEEFGFCFDEGGTHLARTMMFGDLAEVFEVCGSSATKKSVIQAVDEENCLGKPSGKARRLASRHLVKWPTPDLCTTLSERIGVQVTRSVQQGAA